MEIAFNYKYIVESIKNMDSEKIQIGLNGSLSATMFTPVNDDDYICLIMPVQLKDEGRRE